MEMKTYGINVIGTDYIVGDIHGCFTKLEQELIGIGFDYTKDRLFFVGDLVDRGPESEKCLEWLDKPWFIGVRGNHEQMAIDFGTYAGMDQYTYRYNGGGWFIDMKPELQNIFRKAFNQLPLAIELETRIGKVGIVHAEPIDSDWNKTREWLVTQPNICENVCLWARDRITYKITEDVVGIKAVVVGHTPRTIAERLGNVYFIDTGACFDGRGHFTILDAETLKKVN